MSILNYIKRYENRNRKLATFYHVTDRSLLPSIKKKGLYPQKPTSIFGDKSKNDPKAVYTFRNRLSDQIPYQAIEDFKKGSSPAESSTIRKSRYTQVKRDPVILQINMSEEEANKHMLDPSYGARAIEAPLRSWIPPNRIRVMKPGEYARKSGKVISSIQDYHKIGQLGGILKVGDYFEDRGPKALRESEILK